MKDGTCDVKDQAQDSTEYYDLKGKEKDAIQEAGNIAGPKKDYSQRSPEILSRLPTQPAHGQLFEGHRAGLSVRSNAPQHLP